MKYRSLKESDIKKIFLIGKKEFGSRSEYSWDWTIGKLKDYLRSSFGFGIVCTEKNSIIGFALVQKDYSTQKPYTAWLNYLFVDEKYRGKGISRQLFQGVLDFAKKHKVKMLQVIVDERNAHAIEVYKKFGFEDYDKTMALALK